MVFGAGDYAMRVWLDPDKVAARGLTAGDVVRAIREQNVQVAAGVSSAACPCRTAGRLHAVDQRARAGWPPRTSSREIVIKTGEHGEITRLGDVARVELGAGGYSLRSMLDNKHAVAHAASSRRRARTRWSCRRTVRATHGRAGEATSRRASSTGCVYDPTIYVRESHPEVVETLFEAILLVVLVVMLFLQTWRASIIPLLAVPVSIVGTFAVLLAFGFSINTLSLFGLVLAIGIVVDDAIVVVENVERNIAAGLSPREASSQGDGGGQPARSSPSRWCCARCSCPMAFMQRPDRAVLPAVRADHRDLDGDLGDQLADAVAGAARDPAAAARRAPDRLTRVIDFLFGWLFRPLQPPASGARRSATPASSGASSAGAAWCCWSMRGLLAVTAFGVRAVAERLRADAGQAAI